jgi:hypothetical protein
MDKVTKLGFSMLQLKIWLAGKKTYIVSTILVILSLLKLMGVDVPGVELKDPLQTLLEGLGLGTLRAGLSKNQGS